jgi:hypothetical protein
MLSEDEERDKQEMITLTEQVLDAKGIECDARIAKISEDKLREILEEVRKLRKKKMNSVRSGDTKSNDDRYIQNEEGTYIQ